MGGEAAAGGDRLISRRWWRTSCMQARRCVLRLQSRQSSGADPTGSGCKSTLTWRGFLVAPPFHWHCSRRGQGRQLRMLAAYTTRRLPSASRRRSWGVNDFPAGQQSVPSAWRGKSAPEKRPAFQEVAVLGGAYPDAGAAEDGGVGACSLRGAHGMRNEV
jgi:hypothetical protein